MPAPSTSLSTLRPDLAGSFMEFELEMQRRNFIGAMVLPVVSTAKQSGVFGKIPIEQLLQQRETLRAPGAHYARGNFTFTTDTFACVEHGFEEPIDDREAAMYSEYFSAEQVSAARAFEAVLQAAEQRAAALLFNTTTFTPTTVTNEWDDFTNATPINDVESRVQAVYDASGLWPNSLIISRKVFRNLRQCDQIRDRIASSGAGDSVLVGRVTVQQIAQAFDLENVFVGGGTKNTAIEGQSFSGAEVWSGEYAMIAKVANTNDIREPCIGRTFHWSEDGSMIDGRVETYREEAARSDIVRVRHDVDEKILYTEAAALLDNITT